MPRSPLVIRPSGVTAVASTITSATPPTARLPRWTRCQSLASPSAATYWHMGDITIRLRNVTPRIVSGLSRSDSGTSRSWSVPAGQPWARTRGTWSAGRLAVGSSIVCPFYPHVSSDNALSLIHRLEQHGPVLLGPLAERGRGPPADERHVVPHRPDVAHASVHHLPHEFDHPLGVVRLDRHRAGRQHGFQVVGLLEVAPDLTPQHVRQDRGRFRAVQHVGTQPIVLAAVLLRAVP